MQNDCSLIQITRYKQMPLHKDPLMLWVRVDKGIYRIIIKRFFQKQGELVGMPIFWTRPDGYGCAARTFLLFSLFFFRIMAIS